MAVRMVQDQKVEVQVGDQVRSADFRSEYHRQIGIVTRIHCGYVRVEYPGGGWESTGAQWFTWVGRPVSGS